MPNIQDSVEVWQAAVMNDGSINIHLRSKSGKWQGTRWWRVPNGTPNAASFLAIALTCISTGLSALVLIDGGLVEGSDLVYISAVRT